MVPSEVVPSAMAMRVDILSLFAKFREVNDRDFERVVYRTHTPHRAPLGYHTTLFKPVPAELRERRTRSMQMPPSLCDLYEQCNGAVLFGGTIRLYGLRPDEYFLDRADWFRQPWPIDVLEVNAAHADELRERNSICIGDYCQDISLVCMERDTAAVTCFVGQGFRQKRAAWNNLEEWLTEEARRLEPYFDELGVCLADEALLLPGRIQ